MPFGRVTVNAISNAIGYLIKSAPTQNPSNANPHASNHSYVFS